MRSHIEVWGRALTSPQPKINLVHFGRKNSHPFCGIATGTYPTNPEQAKFRPTPLLQFEKPRRFALPTAPLVESPVTRWICKLLTRTVDDVGTAWQKQTDKHQNDVQELGLHDWPSLCAKPCNLLQATILFINYYCNQTHLTMYRRCCHSWTPKETILVLILLLCWYVIFS